MKTEKTIKHLLREQEKELYERYEDKSKYLIERIKELECQLEESRNLKAILDRMSKLTIDGKGFSVTDGSWRTANLPDNVLVYVDDILGGKVIKQEGIKCIVIKSDGTVQEGLTSRERDPKYNYKLVRE
jgi:hypothetical protein